MNNIKVLDPILVTGAERSGSTFIARILNMCDVWSGNCNKMYENREIFSLYPMRYKKGLFPDTRSLNIPFGWNYKIYDIIKKQGWTRGHWFLKHSKLAQYWPVWHYTFPDAKWVVVRRKTSDVVESCIKTGFMQTFKKKENLDLLGMTSEDEGWLWWIHQYEKKFVEMIETGVNVKVIWPDRMADGDFQQVQEMVHWLGLEWNENIPDVIMPLISKNKKQIKWQGQRKS